MSYIPYGPKTTAASQIGDLKQGNYQLNMLGGPHSTQVFRPRGIEYTVREDGYKTGGTANYTPLESGRTELISTTNITSVFMPGDTGLNGYRYKFVMRQVGPISFDVNFSLQSTFAYELAHMQGTVTEGGTPDVTAFTEISRIRYDETNESDGDYIEFWGAGEGKVLFRAHSVNADAWMPS